VKHKTLLIRVGDAIRQSAMILDQGSDFIVLWTGDTDSNGEPNLAEVQRIDRDTGFKELRNYRAPDDLNPADNTQYDLATTDFNAATNAVKGAGQFPAQVWGTGIENLQFWGDDADPRNARLICFRLDVRVGKLTDSIVGGAALR
jgi:hypothetical protein